MINWIRRLLGIKADDQVQADVNAEPTIQRARQELEHADRILADYQEKSARLRMLNVQVDVRKSRPKPKRS